MCGLVGIAGEIGLKEERMFSDLLTLDVIRGKDSTGVAAVSQLANTFNLHVVKAAKSSPDFMALAGYKGIGARVNRILLGHNRYATRGLVTDENAHPFEFERIVGAHNGSLVNYTKMFEHEKYTVDSQALYSNMNENGVEDTWGKVDGAAALTWIDKSDMTVNFLRNKERPLFYCYGNKGRTLMWASEPWMIQVAAARQGVECDGKCHEVTINNHYRFNVPLTADKKERVTVTRSEVKPYVRPAYSYGNYGNWGSQYDDDYRDYRAEGKRFLDAEGVATGDTVFFTVDKIKDYLTTTNVAVSTILGKTIDNKVPVRVLNLDTEKNDELILSMWDNEEGVFSGRVSYADEIGIVLSAYSIVDCHYDLSDLEEARLEAERLEKQKKAEPQLDKDSLGEGNHSKKDNAVDSKENVQQTLEAANESTEVKPSLKVIPYKIACSYCRLLVNAYMVDKEAGVTVCCEDCWDNHFAALSTEQRSAVKIGAFSRQANRH